MEPIDLFLDICLSETPIDQVRTMAEDVVYSNFPDMDLKDRTEKVESTVKMVEKMRKKISICMFTSKVR